MQMLFDKINNGSPFEVIREVFSFNVSNNFLSGKSRLTIEVPRFERII